jgi:hypothetical protein
MGSPDGAAKCHVSDNLPNNIPKQGRTQRGGVEAGQLPPPWENNIYDF